MPGRPGKPQPRDVLSGLVTGLFTIPAGPFGSP
jgi:hypothetical protein